MKIGAQLFTIRKFAQDEEGIAASFKRIADIGFKTAQVSALGPIAPEKLRDISQSTGVEVIITHTSPLRILEDTDNVIKEHKIFGCKNVGIGAMPQKYTQELSLESTRAFIKDFTPVAQKLADNGLKLHYHNHSFEFYKFGGRVLYDVMAEEFPADLLGFITDTYWVQAGGRCPAEQIKALKGRVNVCHFKDMQLFEGRARIAPVMEGNLCWKEILAACNEAGVEYAMIELDEIVNQKSDDPFDALKLSLDNLKTLGCEA